MCVGIINDPFVAYFSDSVAVEIVLKIDQYLVELVNDNNSVSTFLSLRVKLYTFCGTFVCRYLRLVV